MPWSSVLTSLPHSLPFNKNVVLTKFLFYFIQQPRLLLNWVLSGKPVIPFNFRTPWKYCQAAVWSDLATFYNFGEIYQFFGNLSRVYLVTGKIFDYFGNFGQIFIVLNILILNKSSSPLVILPITVNDR